MQLYKFRHVSRAALIAGFIAGLAACGGGSGSASMTSTATTTNPPPPQMGQMSFLMSDASSDDWATIGGKVLSLSLTPQGGGTPVTVFTAPAAGWMVNLEELDQISEILANTNVPVGTYTAATLTMSGNPGDVALTVSADPETGFAAQPGANIPSSQIDIQGTQGTAGSLTVPIKVTYESPLVVSASQSNALDLEFDLAHPAFIVAHTPPGAGTTIWAVNFNGPLRHHPIADIRHLILRHMYGTVTAVASDNSSISITKDLPVLPVVNPETPVATATDLQILADATNGTIFYDVDAKTVTTVKSFATEASSLDGKFVRIAARYQEDGTLVAVRLWASSTFNTIWKSPEGHVLHVDTTNDVINVLNESGESVPVTVSANTQFFFRTPANAIADATPIAVGTTFLTDADLVRGFKVHVSAVDPLATPMVAQSIDIETAAYSGVISAANMTGFTDTRTYRTAADDYMVNLDYISTTSANGAGATGTATMGFKFWDFAYPTLATTGAAAIPDFMAATSGAVNFGGTAGSVSAWGVSYATWEDPVNATGWAIPSTILLPTPLPLGTVAAGYASNAFTMNVVGGATPAIVGISTTAGSATLVYQVDRTGNVITVTAIDVTTTSGVASLTAGLAVGAKVKIYGVPQADGTLKAYVVTYFTGTAPTS